MLRMNKHRFTNLGMSIVFIATFMLEKREYYPSLSRCSRLIVYNCNSSMSDAYSIVGIPKSLPIHGMALTSTGRKIEHNKVVVVTQTFYSYYDVQYIDYNLTLFNFFYI